jgi:hypothetical protein
MKYLKTGDLIYVPAHITLMEFDETIDNIEVDKTYIGPSPVKCHNLEKPTNVLLLENTSTNDWLPVLYNGEKMYINKNDILPYQEER